MPFWDWQMEFMQSSLTNLHPIECPTLNGIDVSHKENTEKRARIVNHCYASDEYRKIRMTYYDAGDSVQVFNSVWYPDPKYNLPVLGIDLLSFNRKRYLAIVDFQPLHEDESDHATTYEHILKPIKEKYENLKGRMSSKFYDETQFFSKEMLFARFSDGDVVQEDLLPAFQSYVETHLNLVKSTPPETSAEDFIYDFLFSLSERSEEGLDFSPPGPPKPRGGKSGGAGGPSVQGVAPVNEQAPKETSRVDA